jgi:hypothetical protein
MMSGIVGRMKSSHAMQDAYTRLAAAFDHLRGNETVEMYWMVTGLPFSVAGLYFQRFFTIAQAAPSSRPLPLDCTTVHSLTEPDSLTT